MLFMKTILAFDVGGTHIRAGLVDPKGQILDLVKVVAPIQRDEKSFAAFLGQIVQSYSKNKKHAPQAVSLGIPGIVSSKKGIVFSSPHYPEWHNFNIVASLKKYSKIPVSIDNDAHMIARGEGASGAARGWENFLLFTLGTGIGGAIVINKKVFHGTSGFTGEFGHVAINSEGPQCGCGGYGCLETYASGSGLVRMIEEAALEYEHPHSRALAELLHMDRSQIVKNLALKVKEGNVLARDLFGQFGYYLGMGMASIINVTGIQNVVISGGIIKSAPLFMPHLKQELEKRLYKKTFEDVKIRLAKLGDKAGLVGAAEVVLSKQ